MAQIPRGRLVENPYKPICRDCAMYFSITVLGNRWKLVIWGLDHLNSRLWGDTCSGFFSLWRYFYYLEYLLGRKSQDESKKFPPGPIERTPKKPENLKTTLESSNLLGPGSVGNRSNKPFFMEWNINSRRSAGPRNSNVSTLRGVKRYFCSLFLLLKYFSFR